MAQPKAVSRSTRDAGPATLGAGVRIRGRISGDGDLTILGTVEGSVVVRGELTIGEGATVTADELSATAVNVAGSVSGNVLATGAVHLSQSANVRGDLKGSSISMDEGAQFAGRIDADFELPPELAGKSR